MANPFEQYFNELPPDKYSVLAAKYLAPQMPMQPAHRPKLFGGQQSTIGFPNDPSAEVARQQISQLPQEAITAPIDLAMMGTGDLLNKAASGYSGLGAAAGSYFGGGNVDTALQAGAEAVQNYKAPEGPARQLQERPRSKMLESAFAPVSSAIETGAQYGEKLGIPAEATRGISEFLMDMAMGKGGMKMAKGVSPGLITQPFYSEVQRAVEHPKFPDAIKPESTINALRKLGNIKDAELNMLGIPELVMQKAKAGEKITKQELLDHVGARTIDLGESIYGASGKQPQFSTHKAIKSYEGIVPGSYAEEFVTSDSVIIPDGVDLKNLSTREVSELLNKSTWKDEHPEYNDTQNPLVRIRYDVKEYPGGKKTLRIHEIQDPKEVRRGRTGEGIVPKELSERAMDLGIKKAIFRAKELGADGIEWATGEQTKDLYNSTLRNVADEARWNPETKLLQVYKSGYHVKDIPNVPKEKIEEYIGKSGARRLLENDPYSAMDEWEPHQFIDNAWVDPSGFSIINEKLNPDIRDYGYLPERPFRVDMGPDGPVLNRYATLEEAKQASILPEHVTTDLSIDASWPTKLYGDFANIELKNIPPEILKKHFDKFDWGEQIPSAFNELSVEDLKFVEDHFQRVNPNEYNNAAKSVGGKFNEKALVPSLLKKYGKGEFGPTDQPVMWFTDKTPSSFPIYEGVTGIFNMLSEQVKKNGGKAKGIAITAAQIGIPAAALSAFLISDSEKRKSMLKSPTFANIIKIIK